MTEKNRRKVVLHPKTALARRHDRARAFGGHVRGYTVDTDEVLLLLRAQRRLSLKLLLLLFTPVVALPLLFEFVPAARTWQPFGFLPLPWLLLGPVVLFTVLGIAAYHEQKSLRIENDWRDSRLGR